MKQFEFDKTEAYWVMHNLSGIPKRLTPNCPLCGDAMVNDPELVQYQMDFDMEQIFKDEGIDWRVEHCNYATEVYYCPECDKKSELEESDFDVMYGHKIEVEVEGIRWYFGGCDYINGRPELPSETRKRMHLEQLHHLEQSGQQTLPGFPSIDFDAELG